MSVGWETFKKKRQEAADHERLLARVNLEMEDNREKCASLMDAVDHNRLDGKVNIVTLQDQRFIIHDRDKAFFVLRMKFCGYRKCSRTPISRLRYSRRLVLSIFTARTASLGRRPVRTLKR